MEEKSENTSLIVREEVSLEQWQGISEVLVAGVPDEAKGTPLHKYIAEEFGLSLGQVLTVITHPQFCKWIANLKKAMAKAEFTQLGYDTLVQVMKTGKNREKIAAVKELAVQLGTRAPDGPQINLKIDNIIGQLDRGEITDVEAEEVEDFPGF